MLSVYVLVIIEIFPLTILYDCKKIICTRYKHFYYLHYAKILKQNIKYNHGELHGSIIKP